MRETRAKKQTFTFLHEQKYIYRKYRRNSKKSKHNEKQDETQNNPLKKEKETTCNIPRKNRKHKNNFTPKT